MLLDDPKSTQPATKSGELPRYAMRKEFIGANYAKRYEICCERLMRERLYDAACFIMSSATADGPPRGRYSESNAELSLQNFATSIMARVAALAKHKGGETRS
jgi:hypothetical protein